MSKKVLIFTSSYRRPMFLRTCILGVMNQSYEDYIHSVNITLDNTIKTKDYYEMFMDISNLKLIINYNQNNHTHINALTAIKAVPDYMDYDIFVKMDDDDIYKQHYVKTIVECFENTGCDTCSSMIHVQLNGVNLNFGSYNNLGNSPQTEMYKMPMTYSFNRKALDVIINEKPSRTFDDMMWRDLWANAGLKHEIANNSGNVIWHVHGANVSVGNFLNR